MPSVERSIFNFRSTITCLSPHNTHSNVLSHRPSSPISIKFIWNLCFSSSFSRCRLVFPLNMEFSYCIRRGSLWIIKYHIGTFHFLEISMSSSCGCHFILNAKLKYARAMAWKIPFKFFSCVYWDGWTGMKLRVGKALWENLFEVFKLFIELFNFLELKVGCNNRKMLYTRKKTVMKRILFFVANTTRRSNSGIYEGKKAVWYRVHSELF